MSEIPLNKFEKHDLVINLHKEGRIYREIAHMASIATRYKKPILKKYEQKLETKKREANNQSNQKINKLSPNNQSNQKINKLSPSSRAFILFRKGKTPLGVKVFTRYTI